MAQDPLQEKKDRLIEPAKRAELRATQQAGLEQALKRQQAERFGLDAQEPAIKESFDKLRAGGENQDAGYRGSAGYPREFQVSDFPALAGKNKVEVLAADQAYFFLDKPQGDNAPEQIRLKTDNLKKLMRSVADNGTDFTMMLDADLMLNKDRFIEKYSNLQQTDETKAHYKNVFEAEQREIGGFLQSGGIRKAATEMMEEKTGAKGDELSKQVDDFLKNNFRVKGVMNQEALQAATWKVETKDGAMMAKQVYSMDIPEGQQRWQVGTQPELAGLKEKGHVGATAIMDAVASTDAMRKIEFSAQGTETGGQVVPGKVPQQGAGQRK
ncbi:MAG: hypothetical protein AB7L92_04275 [Alphaproteobacteria bacterium]